MEEKMRVIALGFFDGVHRGHGALLSRCVERAGELGAVPTAFTFDIHPSSLILRSPVPLLTTPADRAGLMQRCYGIRDVIIGHYDENMMRLPWRDFITDYLIREHGAVHLVVGHDFHFGYKGEGDPKKLVELCRELGVGCDVISKVELEGMTVSSTYIRTLVAQGEMARAVEFLGHAYVLTDVVRHGKKLGSKIGMPTVNLHLSPSLLVPAHGVYVTRAVLEDGSSWPAVTNVGVRPTVDDGGAVTVEGYLLGFQGDLYGQEVRLEFFDFLRPEQKFTSLEALHAQVLRDAQATRDYFDHH